MSKNQNTGRIVLLVEEYFRLVWSIFLFIIGIVLGVWFKDIVNAIANGQKVNISDQTYNIVFWVGVGIAIFTTIIIAWCIINLNGLHNAIKKQYVPKGYAISALVGAICTTGLVNIILGIVGIVMILKHDQGGTSYQNQNPNYMQQMPPQNYRPQQLPPQGQSQQFPRQNNFSNDQKHNPFVNNSQSQEQVSQENNSNNSSKVESQQNISNQKTKQK